MAVGTTPLVFYQGENVKPRFTVSDPNVTDITGWTITLVIKETAAELDPPLHSANASIIGGAPTLIFDVDTQIPLSIPPGTYVYSVRRTNVGFDWQLAQGSLTVLDSAHKDVA